MVCSTIEARAEEVEPNPDRVAAEPAGETKGAEDAAYDDAPDEQEGKTAQKRALNSPGPLRGTDTYSLWIGNVQVTESNKNDILGDGTARYDSDTHTLTLSDPKITTPYSNGACTAGIFSEMSKTLTITGSADLSTQGTNNAIYTPNSDLIIDGFFKANGSTYGIAASGKTLTISGGKVSVKGTTGIAAGVASVMGGEVTVDASSTGIMAGELRVTSGTLDVRAGNDSTVKRAPQLHKAAGPQP